MKENKNQKLLIKPKGWKAGATIHCNSRLKSLYVRKIKWPGFRLTPNQTKSYWIWQIIDENSNMIHHSTRQHSSDKVDQTEDNILKHPICKWPRGSKKWLICNFFKTLVKYCKFTVTMTNFFSLLIYIIKSRSINRYFQSDHEFYSKTRAILNYNQNCSIWSFTYTLASFIPRGSSSRVLQERALKRS